MLNTQAILLDFFISYNIKQLTDEIEAKRQKRNKEARIRRLEKTLKALKSEEDK